jgi:hypothetical protein
MAKTLSEDLLALLDADTQAKVKAAFASKPELIARDLKGAELIEVWSEFGGELEPAAPPVSVPHTPTLPSSAGTPSGAAAPVAATPAAPSNADGLATVLASINGLKSDLDNRFKNVVTVDKLPEYRKELLTLAISSTAAYDDIRDAHREEFGERLDFDKFKAFVEAPENFVEGKSKFPSMRAAHDVFVADKRKASNEAKEKAKIDAAVAEALKQARSAGTVPGQTQTASLSPAQQVIAKARAAATGNDGESNAMRVARELEALERNRQTVQ